MHRHQWRCTALLCWAVAGCGAGETDSPVDASVIQAGMSGGQAGAAGSAMRDASVDGASGRAADAQPPDAGRPDSDTSAVEAGAAGDTGRPDARQTTDASATDSATGSASRWRPEFVGIDSSWETAIGADDSAILDTSGSRWDSIEGANPSLLTVVEASSEGIAPIHGTHVMRMGVQGEDNRMLVDNQAFDTRGDCRYTRMYQHVVCVGDDISQIHHFEDWDDAGSSRFLHRLYEYRASDGRWSVSPQSYADQSRVDARCPGQLANAPGGLMTLRHPDSTNPADEHDDNGLHCGRWYRIETQECCVEGDADCWDVGLDEPLPIIARVRVYDESGARVLGEDDLYTQLRAGIHGLHSMEDIYAAGACWMVESALDLALGNNGQSGVTAVAPALMYWDAILTGSSDDRRATADPWIGPCDAPGCF